jgi:hypothetical protein
VSVWSDRFCKSRVMEKFELHFGNSIVTWSFNVLSLNLLYMAASETFQQFIGDFGEYSWVVLFVKAPIDIVSATYAKIVSCEVDSNVPISSISLDSSESYSPTGSIVKIIDSDWTILFHIVGDWNTFDSQYLSKKLKVNVLEFSAEDTSGAVGCILFSPNEDIITYLTSDDSEYQSEIYDEAFEHAKEVGIEMSQPKESIIVENYEKLFESLGIRTVNLSINESRTVVAIEDNQRSQVLQVDLVKL